MQVLEIGVRLGLEGRTDGWFQGSLSLELEKSLQRQPKNPGNMYWTMEATLRMGGG